MPNMYVNILHYVDYDNTEELVSYPIDLSESFERMKEEVPEIVDVIEHITDGFRDEMLLIKSIICAEVVSIMAKEINRTEDSDNPFETKIAELAHTFVEDDNAETVSIDFGDKKNMVLELEKVYY